MKRFTLIGFLLLAAFLLAACSSEAQPTASGEQLNSGELAPAFELTDLEGNVQNLADYEGEKVYVKYWASWCSICLSGMEELNRLAGQDTDFKVLTIVSPGANNEKDTEAFKKWYSGLEDVSNIEVLLDEGGDIAEQYGVRGFPTSAYIGSDGVLVKTAVGHVSNEQIIEQFESIQ